MLPGGGFNQGGGAPTPPSPEQHPLGLDGLGVGGGGVEGAHANRGRLLSDVPFAVTITTGGKGAQPAAGGAGGLACMW